jgi:uncharacterized membrane protein
MAAPTAPEPVPEEPHHTIKSPPEWGWDHLKLSLSAIGSASADEYWPEAIHRRGVPEVRRIGVADLRTALKKGFDDFGANRTDVIFICAIYPVVGLILGRLAFGYYALPMVFPLASGFALVGPLAAIGLYEMSRRREQGAEINWMDAFGFLRSPSIGAIAFLGALLIAIYTLWLLVAQAIYYFTLGPEAPISIASFLHDVFRTRAGWAMIVVGVGVGFLFAVAVLTISVVSFPLLLDRNVRLGTAIRTSARAVVLNPITMALWGLIIAAGLVVGSIPFFLGLIVVLPVLGHATWHLYRSIVPR